MDPAWREGGHKGRGGLYLHKPATDVITQHAPRHGAGSTRRPREALPGAAVRPDKASRGRRMGPAWREGVNKGCAVFYLNKPATDVIIQHAPGKIIDPAFVCSLTVSQLRLLL